MQAAQQEALNAIHQLPDNTNMDDIRSMYPAPAVIPAQAGIQ